MQKLKSFVLFLQGKKLYICAGLAGLVFTLQLLGVLGEDVAKVLLGLLGFGGMTALGARVSRLQLKG